MRDIEFRGKRVTNGEWIYGLLTDYAIDVCRINPTNDFYEFEVLLESVGEYTGVKDRTGNKIYEGMKVKSDYGNGFEGTVYYQSQAGQWWVNIERDDKKRYMELCTGGMSGGEDGLWLTSVEVIPD